MLTRNSKVKAPSDEQSATEVKSLSARKVSRYANAGVGGDVTLDPANHQIVRLGVVRGIRQQEE